MKVCSFIIVIAALLSACASTPMASKEEDAAAKKFQASPNTSRIYLYRNENFGAAVKIPVIINDKLAGDTVAKSYIVQDLAPGKNTIQGKAENDSTITLDTVAGKIYYIWQEIKMGFWGPGNQLHQVDEATGQAGVLESNMIAPIK
ncbi:DUF2846 domain-containing protein [Neisseriaceae bacterium TC5R-5]|nr:DUF2846 domain-containing protein [Neisseriaceae bacterium TC5R-5]